MIGASIAYFLSCRGVEATVIERTGLACAASGKSGGFLALDWCDGTPLGPLARRSFALHAGWREEIDGDWGYRRLDTYGGVAGSVGRRRAATPTVSTGCRADVTMTRRLGSTETTAQVHPGNIHRGDDARGAGARAPNCASVASPASCAAGEAGVDRRRGRWRDRRGRCRRDRDGAVVDPRRAVAAAAARSSG